MTLNPLQMLAGGGVFETLLPDFLIALTFFTALVYAVLSKRLDHQRSAVAVAVAVGVALSVGLVWWEAQTGWSVRSLGPLTAGLGLVLLATVIYQVLRQFGGNWSGAALAFGVTLLIGLTLGLDWPMAQSLVQTAAVLLVAVGAVLMVLHRQGPSGTNPDLPRGAMEPELNRINQDLREVPRERQTADQISSSLDYIKRNLNLAERHPGLRQTVLTHIARVLPAEGWLTEQLARLRARAELIRNGHLAKLQELQRDLNRLPAEARESLSAELRARYQALKFDTRLERLDRSVAEAEKRVKELTAAAHDAVAKGDARRGSQLIDNANRLQKQIAQLMGFIQRDEARLAGLVTRLARGTTGAKTD